MAITKYQRIMSAAGVLSLVGVVAAPVFASAVADTEPTTINAVVGEAIAVTTSGTVALNITPATGGALTSNSDTVTVSTNNGTGYTLAVNDTDATVTLVNGGNSIAAHAGTVGTPTALANNTWGFAVAGAPFDVSYAIETNVTSSSTKWAGMPASGSPATIRTTNSNVIGEATTVWYAAKVDLSKPDGTYTDSVTYTATTQ